MSRSIRPSGTASQSVGQSSRRAGFEVQRGVSPERHESQRRPSRPTFAKADEPTSRRETRPAVGRSRDDRHILTVRWDRGPGLRGRRRLGLLLLLRLQVGRAGVGRYSHVFASDKARMPAGIGQELQLGLESNRGLIEGPRRTRTRASSIKAEAAWLAAVKELHQAQEAEKAARHSESRDEGDPGFPQEHACCRPAVRGTSR